MQSNIGHRPLPRNTIKQGLLLSASSRWQPSSARHPVIWPEGLNTTFATTRSPLQNTLNSCPFTYVTTSIYQLWFSDGLFYIARWATLSFWMYPWVGVHVSAPYTISLKSLLFTSQYSPLSSAQLDQQKYKSTSSGQRTNKKLIHTLRSVRPTRQKCARHPVIGVIGSPDIAPSIHFVRFR